RGVSAGCLRRQPSDGRDEMNKRKAAIGIAVLFALGLSAFAAASASATGLTAYTCVTDPSGPLLGDHCLTAAQGGSGGASKHVEIAQNETTTGTWTNAKTASGTTAAQSAIVHGSLAGVATEITCSEVHSEGTFENRKNASGEHYFHYEGQVHFTGCVVKKPAEKGCKISGETITTVPMTFTSEGVAQPDHRTSTRPKEGTKITEIKIEGCSIAALNNTFPLSGSVSSKLSGATARVIGVDSTGENTLKFGGVKAGLDMVLTPTAHSKAGEETKPLSFTTT
ncbi:MAG TPA: hypothetical protein VFJ57_03415, partial [Solirubrobacterales bacterium]|nr:hypothetical protein [Solirubrobacterales bacterium]